jgi:uncharacterized membrane protein YhaH (DUF805 family)
MSSQVDFGLGTGLSKVGGLTNGNISGEDKWWISLLVALIVFVVFATPTFVFTNSIFGGGKGYGKTWAGGPGATLFGLFLHSVVVMLIVRLILG